jgi:cell division protein FtsI/penicillin-binding protein 2
VGNAVKLNAYPTHLEIPLHGGQVESEIHYAFVPSAQEHVQKLFNTYKPDYGAFVALDAKTGRILTMVSYTRGEPYLGNLALRAIFPSASVFKVITATAAIDGHDLKPETVIPFNGRPHTLYRRNVEQTQFNRWTRYMSIKEAFGKSVNTVFAKLGIFYIGPHSLREYAKRFKFNNSVPADIPVEPAQADIPLDDTFGVA